ncbi:hypothetical protein COR50_05415 [Chitinophaga caeni]|uniref:DUF2891 domain-containing protein n=1 Tax=Chitinophaga caeni TaxID=2029983 RepID=A0A291R0D7_9BACT|nr:DUF2891 domain-containing protein [Chitinophaga caeni]ATL49739.1 hypothetical protein COR50_05415 [Chitinophaga caeni]
MAQLSTPLYTQTKGKIELSVAGAEHLASLPLRCMQQEYPYKTGIVFPDSDYTVAPINYHPAFYGCFDWHSSVHGHWTLVRLLKEFKNLPSEAVIKKKLTQNLSAANILQEIKVFKNKENRGFERIYGWSWLLQLYAELYTWQDPLGQQLAANVEPLAKYIAQSYISFLSNLAYAIRVGEHTNLAFGLSLAWDYASTVKDEALQAAIKSAATRFYANDKNAPVQWEPGGYDFLSPSLEEADLMWRILPAAEYQKWLHEFLPGLYQHPDELFKITIVNDRTDGKLVHLEGLNLSRAWCLFNISKHAGANEAAIKKLALEHLDAALPNVVSGHYSGDHWLGTFAVYAIMRGL